jgi:hypothetical protein
MVILRALAISLCAVPLSWRGVTAQAPVSHPLTPLLRLEGGMLNPGGPFTVTMAYGGSLGLSYRRHALLLRVVRQSQNRNSGPDLTSNARLFGSLAWEYQGVGEEIHQRQGIVRLGLGLVARESFRTAWFLDAAFGLRYRLARSVGLIGTLQYAPVIIPGEAFIRCGYGEGPLAYYYSCRPAQVEGRLQHNVGFLVALELRPW